MCSSDLILTVLRDRGFILVGRQSGARPTVARLAQELGVPYAAIGDREDYQSLPYGGGIPKAVADMTIPVPFNDAPAMERRIERLAAEGRLPACVIMEAAMMNLGVVLPEPGYLEAVRAITRKHGIVLIFDEVKTGICIAAGGAVERFGVMPDMVTLAKAVEIGRAHV